VQRIQTIGDAGGGSERTISLSGSDLDSDRCRESGRERERERERERDRERELDSLAAAVGGAHEKDRRNGLKVACTASADA
jgi:hypothetical protein